MPVLRLVSNQADFGLALHLAHVMDARTGAGAGDLIVHFLGAGVGGSNQAVRRKRNRNEAFSRARPGAGGAQAVPAVVVGRGVGMSGSAADNFEMSQDYGAIVGTSCRSTHRS